MLVLHLLDFEASGGGLYSYVEHDGQDGGSQYGDNEQQGCSLGVETPGGLAVGLGDTFGHGHKTISNHFLLSR